MTLKGVPFHPFALHADGGTDALGLLQSVLHQCIQLRLIHALVSGLKSMMVLEWWFGINGGGIELVLGGLEVR